jgi:hypothetical protein
MSRVNCSSTAPELYEVVAELATTRSSCSRRLIFNVSTRTLPRTRSIATCCCESSTTSNTYDDQQQEQSVIGDTTHTHTHTHIHTLTRSLTHLSQTIPKVVDDKARNGLDTVRHFALCLALTGSSKVALQRFGASILEADGISIVCPCYATPSAMRTDTGECAFVRACVLVSYHS